MENEFIDISRSFVEKIVQEIPRTHKSCINDKSMPIDSNGDLSKWEYMIESIGIPSHPRLSSPLNVAVTYSQIWTGLQLHKGALEAVKDRLSSPEVVRDLIADMKELLDHIGLALQHHNVSPSPKPEPFTASQLDDYQVRVLTHVTLVRLLHFGQEVSRFLRTQVPSDLQE
ncbi:hypothetical protein ACEWY4_003658 [Coilia grayii]|uniref:Uncharacterized protein n=1 Tax=Coilia grayii TaxID=363190 RepID=A0ABD1KRY4_9TELE